MSGAIQPSQPNSCATGVSRRQLLQITVAATLAGAITTPAAKASDSFVEMGRSSSCALPTNNTSLKQRAKHDYQTSLQQYGGRLANDIQELIRTSSRPPHEQFAVTIIGSGYGAAICAARLSASLSPGFRICILERGREWVPGTFPDTFREASRQTRQKLTGQKKGPDRQPARSVPHQNERRDQYAFRKRPRRNVADQRQRGAQARCGRIFASLLADGASRSSDPRSVF